VRDERLIVGSARAELMIEMRDAGESQLARSVQIAKKMRERG